MNAPLFAAAILMVLTGLVHSILGHFGMRLRELPRVPGFPAFFGADQFHPRTIRVTWHVATMLAWAMAAILFDSARAGALDPGRTFAIRAIAVSMIGSGAIVVYGTRARHPAWIVMFTVAGLSWTATS